MSGPMPQLQQADLDPATLDALFADLAQCAQIDEVLVKGAADGRAGRLAGLEQARAALAAGARAVQIRYRWQGATWLDTLMRTPQGVRIVRTAVPQEAP